MTIMIAGCSLALAVAALGSFAVGRIVSEKKDAQRAADEAALAAATAIREVGMPFTAAKIAAVEALARQNSKHPMSFQWQVDDHLPDRVTFSVVANAGLPMPHILYPSGAMTVTARATGEIRQERYDDANKLYPQLVLVLDFSGSMHFNKMVGGGTWSDLELRSSVNTLLGLNLHAKFGAVLFSGAPTSYAPFDTVGIGLNTSTTIHDKVNARLGDGLTITWTALDKARGLFDALPPSDESRFVLLVTDGVPNDDNMSLADARNITHTAAVGLWNDDVEIWTLHILNDQSQAATLEAFMKSISGPPDDRGAADHYVRAASGQDLKKQFAGIASAIACPIGPLVPVPPDPAHMHVFVRESSGEETPLRDAKLDGAAKFTDLNNPDLAFSGQNYFFYRDAKQKIYVTEQICDHLTNDHASIVVRYANATLTH